MFISGASENVHLSLYNSKSTSFRVVLYHCFDVRRVLCQSIAGDDIRICQVPPTKNQNVDIALKQSTSRILFQAYRFIRGNRSCGNRRCCRRFFLKEKIRTFLLLLFIPEHKDIHQALPEMLHCILRSNSFPAGTGECSLPKKYI